MKIYEITVDYSLHYREIGKGNQDLKPVPFNLLLVPELEQQKREKNDPKSEFQCSRKLKYLFSFDLLTLSLTDGGILE